MSLASRLVDILEAPDIHHLRAAEGWLELGNAREAQSELDCLSDVAQGLPEVIAVRWGILAHFKKWEQSIVIANRLIDLAPSSALGWIHRSYALHELKRTREARDSLLPAARLFPAVETIAYNLACYECQLGELDKARSWLRRAFKLHDPGELASRAKEDADLKPLWSEMDRFSAEAKRRGDD